MKTVVMARVVLTFMAVIASFAPVAAKLDASDIWKDYNHVQTSCDTVNCASGGCLYENCEQPVSCTGGMCFFRKCKSAACEGGACVFDQTASSKCPGGACRFQNMATTLAEGYCTGGGCTLEDQAHPASFAVTLSE
ncbi:hypothetical protein FI667_g8773, partial [Globisporangium splendens]